MSEDEELDVNEESEETMMNDEEEQREAEEAEIAESQTQAYAEAEQEMKIQDEIGEKLLEELIEDEDPKDIDEKFESFEELSNQLADGDFSNNLEEKNRLLTKLQEIYLKEIKKSEVISEPKQDLDYNAYSITKTSSIISLEFAWIKIDSKIKLLVEKLRDTRFSKIQIESLEKAIDNFRRKCVWKIIDSKKPTNQKESVEIELDTFYEIIMSTTMIYSDFFNCFLSNVQFDYTGSAWLRKDKNSDKYRYYISDLRYKKKIDTQSDPHIPKYDHCDAKIGEEQSKKQRKTLYQGYWQVENMIKELRNYTEHSLENENKPFLKNILGREIEDPVTKNESVGNFLILVSIMFLMAYQFIEVMQTWIDTDVYLGDKSNK